MDFLSSETVAGIRRLAEQITKCKTEIAAAERAFALAIKNRDLIELNGANPDESVREAKAAVDLAKRKLSSARSELTGAFMAGREQCEKARSEIWARIYREIVRPRAERIATALEMFKQTVEDILELIQPDSETIRRLDALDAATEKWNALVDELSTVGAPGNARLSTTAASKNLRASLAESANFHQFEATAKKLKDALNPPPTPRPPLTEEQIAIERERAREAAFVASSRLKAESAELSNREKMLLRPVK